MPSSRFWELAEQVGWDHRDMMARDFPLKFWNYYGVRGNAKSMSCFYRQSLQLLFKWLNRRSQKEGYTWEGFQAMLRMFAIPTPRIVEVP